MIPFSGLSRFSGLFDGDEPSQLNRNTTVLRILGFKEKQGNCAWVCFVFLNNTNKCFWRIETKPMPTEENSCVQRINGEIE